MNIMIVAVTAAFILICCFSTVGVLALKITRRGLTAYLVTAIVLSIGRAGFLWYLWHVSWTRDSNLLASPTLLFLCPEALLIPKLSSYMPAYSSAWDMALPSATIILGSFLWALPFIFINSKKKEPQGEDPVKVKIPLR
jgi:hypothetical protein